MTRVGIIIDAPTKDGRIFDGGAELHTYQLARAAVDYGAAVTIYQPGQSAASTQVRGVAVKTVAADPRHIWVVGTHAALGDGCRRIHYHYLQHVPGVAKRTYATATHHGVYWDIPFQSELADWYPLRGLARFYLPLWRRAQKAKYLQALRRCRDVIATDTSLLKIVQSDWPNLRERITVIPSFFDRTALQNEVTMVVDREVQGAKDAGCLIILVPRHLQLTKGLPFLPKLTELLWERLGPRFLLVVTGDFLRHSWQWRHYKQKIISEVGALRPDVRSRMKLLYGVRREQMESYYHLSDIVVIPTFAYEGTSISALEAMSYGIPVVATNVGGLNEIIDDGISGILVRPNPTALADAVSRLAWDADRRAQLGLEGRRRVERAFSLQVWRDRVRQFIEINGWCL